MIKKIMISILVLVVLSSFVSADDNRSNLEGNVTLVYKLEDNAANTIVVDSTGTKNGYAEANTATMSTVGILGNALTFDGNFVNSTWGKGSYTALTFSAWFNKTGSGDQEYIFDCGRHINSRISILVDGSDEIRMTITNGADSWYEYPGPNPTNGLWYHVYAVWEEGNQDLYLNGVKYDVATYTGLELGGDNECLIGESYQGDNYAWHERLDEVYFFENYTSTDPQGEALWLYNGGAGNELFLSNAAPTFDEDTMNGSVANNTEWTIDINCTDAESDAITYTVNDSFVSINASGWINVTSVEAGNWTNIGVFCNDTINTATWQVFDMEFLPAPANTAPTFDEDTMNGSVANNTAWTIDINCTDTDSDTITYTVNDSFVSINASGWINVTSVEAGNWTNIGVFCNDTINTATWQVFNMEFLPAIESTFSYYYAFENNINDSLENFNLTLNSGTVVYTSDVPSFNISGNGGSFALNWSVDGFRIDGPGTNIYNRLFCGEENGSLSFWANTTNDIETTQRIADWQDGGITSVILSNLTLQLYTSDVDGGSPVILTYAYPPNTWFSVVYTYSSADGYALYLDGLLVNSSATTIPSCYVTRNLGTAFGTDLNGNDDYGGLLDEFRIYNRTLTVGEVSNLYNYGTDTEPSDTCTKPNGEDWNIDFADNCTITGSAIDMGGYNITVKPISGDGTLTINVNITNFRSAHIEGITSSEVRCQEGGGFRLS